MNEMLAALQEKMREKDAIDHFCGGIKGVMDEFGVTLEAAILTVHTMIDDEAREAGDRADPKMPEWLHAMHEKAAEEMRETLEYARKLVEQNDNGKPEAVPMDHPKMLADRARAKARVDFEETLGRILGL